MAHKIREHRIRDFSEIEASYLAGIIDGEGCIYLAKRHNKIFPIIAITNTSEALIEWLQSFCTRRARKLVASRSINHPSLARQLQWSAIEDVKYILSRVLPYLIIKKDKALEALGILESR